MPVEKLAFAVEGCYSSLWQKAITFREMCVEAKAFEKLQRGYSLSLAATVVRCNYLMDHVN